MIGEHLLVLAALIDTEWSMWRNIRLRNIDYVDSLIHIPYSRYLLCPSLVLGHRPSTSE